MNTDSNTFTCPNCAASLDPNTKRCACGYEISSAAFEEAYVAEELVAKAEALYESHLAARVVHARRRLKAAKIDVLRDPHDHDKVSALKQTEEIARKLQAQLVEQSKKTSLAHLAAEEARALLREQSEQKIVNPAPANTADRSLIASETPPESFRAVQAARAETFKREAHPKSTSVAQSTQTEQPPVSHSHERLCSACGRHNPSIIIRCRCGYILHAHGPELPPVMLSHDELAELDMPYLTGFKSDRK